MRRLLSTLILSGVLMSPIALRADDHDKDKHRYFDSSRKDYHEWNEREEKAYRHWLKETRRRDRDWMKANRRDQRAYWEWRHSHPDWDDRH